MILRLLTLGEKEFRVIVDYHRKKGCKIPIDSRHFISHLATKLRRDESEILKQLPDLAVPAAVLVAGTTEYEDAGASRRINIGVILVSSFSCAPEEARASYGRLEAVCSLLTGDAPGAAVNIGGAHVLLNNFQPLEIDNGTNTAFVLDLTAQTSFKMEV